MNTQGEQDGVVTDHTDNGPLNVRLKPSDHEHAEDKAEHNLKKNSEQNLGFTEALEEYKDELNKDFGQFEAILESENARSSESTRYDWDHLQSEYQSDADLLEKKEKDILDQFDARFKVSLHLWLMS